MASRNNDNHAIDQLIERHGVKWVLDKLESSLNAYPFFLGGVSVDEALADESSAKYARIEHKARRAAAWKIARAMDAYDREWNTDESDD